MDVEWMWSGYGVDVEWMSSGCQVDVEWMLSGCQVDVKWICLFVCLFVDVEWMLSGCHIGSLMMKVKWRWIGLQVVWDRQPSGVTLVPPTYLLSEVTKSELTPDPWPLG